MMQTILVTGTLGFIFSNFVRRHHQGPFGGGRLVGVDRAARPHNLDNMYDREGYKFYLADIADTHAMDRIFAIEQPDIVIGGAAESFVDDSINDVMPFLHSNVVGTQVLVKCCLKYGARYVHISTDEVYGQKLSKVEPGWVESCPMAPRNPYAASKACAELVVRAAHETHGLMFQMTRSCNVYGPRQKKENLIPHVIHGLLEHRPIRIHGSGLNFRQYIHVDDVITGIETVIVRGGHYETYNISGMGGTHDNNAGIYSNLEMVDLLAAGIGRKATVTHIQDRKAHDFGYRIDSTKLRALGWEPKVTHRNGLTAIIEHYRNQNGHAYAAA